MWHHQSFLAPRAGRRGVESSSDFRAPPAHAIHGPSLPAVKRREGRAPFVTRTLTVPGVLTCRPTLWLDRRRSSRTHYRLSAGRCQEELLTVPPRVPRRSAGGPGSWREIRASASGKVSAISAEIPALPFRMRGSAARVIPRCRAACVIDTDPR